jgi:hypothetical protein
MEGDAKSLTPPHPLIFRQGTREGSPERTSVSPALRAVAAMRNTVAMEMQALRSST